jgi:heme-degrading monooxygenase HmoA
MFVTITQFPPLIEGQEEAFLEWFEWSNAHFARQDGFIRRILLRPRTGGNYVIVVEHESFDTYVAMVESETQALAFERLRELVGAEPPTILYGVVRE